jgi:hypothetical protein
LEIDVKPTIAKNLNLERCKFWDELHPLEPPVQHATPPQSRTAPRHLQKPRKQEGAQCNGGFCSSLAHYPCRGTSHYAEFNVPELPEEIGPTFFVYYNIDWQAAGPSGSDARMNQFVPQLMLGTPLDDSTGPPLYKPIWNETKTWKFGAQYFFEIFNKTSNKTEGHAATGITYDTTAGETIFTSFELSSDWVWTLSMGVKGDPSRLSSVVVKQPFMGLIASETSSWSEAVYSKAWSNTCWELYGIEGGKNYPSSDQRTIVTIRNPTTAVPWAKWSTGQATCQGAPLATISETHTENEQVIVWDVNRTNTKAVPFAIS